MKAARRHVRRCLWNGRDTIKYLSKANTVNVVIDVIPLKYKYIESDNVKTMFIYNVANRKEMLKAVAIKLGK